MTYTIRPATEADFPAMMQMVQALATFGKEPDAVINDAGKMKDEQDLFKAFVVESEGEIVAMAVYFFAYYTWVGKSLYLDDLYVKAAYRGKGIGSSLLAKVVSEAKLQNCRRVRWQVLNWNTSAIKVYEKIGAEIDNGRSNCDLNLEQINALSHD